jgi:hypothetical protein
MSRSRPTLRYYVGRDAEAVADVLWATIETPPVPAGEKSNNRGNMATSEALGEAKKKAVNPYR